MSNDIKNEEVTPGQEQQQDIAQHPLYIEQQKWFEQFKNNGMNQQFLGQNDCMKILRKKKPHHWKKDRVSQGLVETQDEKKYQNDIDITQTIRNTKIIYIDCNNIKYSCGKWDKFRGRPKKQIQKILKIISLWLKHQEQKIEEVHLIWDVYKMSKIDRLKEKIQKYEIFQQLLEVKQEPKITTFKISVNEKFINFSIQSAHPIIADDLIVNLCQTQNNENTTVVTSDRGLRERLKDAGVIQFIGNGKWWLLKKELAQLQQIL